MNNTQPNKPDRRIPRVLLAWLIFFVAIGLMILAADLAPNSPRKPSYLLQALISIVGASLMLGLWLFVRWSCDRRNFGRLLVGSAIFATCAAILYLEEDWRGKRAWEQCKAELEAKGIVMDWDKYIPAPVPDDQNFFTASTNILVRFKKAQTEAEQKLATQSTWLRIVYETNSFPIFQTGKTNPLLVALITTSTATAANSDPAPNSLVVKLNEPDTPEKVQGLIQKTIGRAIDGAAGFEFSELPLSKLTPAQILLQTATPPSIADIENLVPKDLATNLGRLQVEAGGDGRTFRILLTDVKATAAADYLKWSDQFEPAFDDMREALKRPYAILPGDYSRPSLFPIPNFVAIRATAQTLAQRAQCDFLLGRPDKALREVTLIHNLCRILEKPPTGKPETLVEAMINVAVTGLYVATVADGMRFHSWQEKHLNVLQEQFQAINLPPCVEEAFRTEIVASAHTLEISTPEELQKLFSRAPANLWEKLKNPGFWLLHLVPRGWYYQNMAVAARLEQATFAGFDLPNNLILPGPATNHTWEIEAMLRHWSPWTLWARIAIPNTSKAMQITAYNQTLANEAQIVCALERYHLTHNEYPETLEALMPQFIAKLPHDIIGGQPLHYRRTDNGKFLLYSVGWNEKDDGGVIAQAKGGRDDLENGDWVWKN